MFVMNHESYLKFHSKIHLSLTLISHTCKSMFFICSARISCLKCSSVILKHGCVHTWKLIPHQDLAQSAYVFFFFHLYAAVIRIKVEGDKFKATLPVFMCALWICHIRQTWYIDHVTIQIVQGAVMTGMVSWSLTYLQTQVSQRDDERIRQQNFDVICSPFEHRLNYVLFLCGCHYRQFVSKNPCHFQ